MKAARKLEATLTVVAAALLMPSIAQADAVAQSFLNITNFGITADKTFNVIAPSSSGDVSASLNGAPASEDSANLVGLGVTFNIVEQQGPDAALYTPGAKVVGFPGWNLASSSSSLAGNALDGTAVAKVDNAVLLSPGGVGTTQSNVTLESTFTLDVANDNTTFTVDFDAEGFLRANLDPLFTVGNARASFAWGINILDILTQDLVFSWTPDGAAGGITGGTEVQDSFDLDTFRSINIGGFNVTYDRSGGFTANTDALAAGLYQVTVTQTSTADATLRVPEPTALSLAALALLGAGLATRRARKG